MAKKILIVDDSATGPLNVDALHLNLVIAAYAITFRAALDSGGWA